MLYIKATRWQPFKVHLQLYYYKGFATVEREHLTAQAHF